MFEQKYTYLYIYKYVYNHTEMQNISTSHGKNVKKPKKNN